MNKKILIASLFATLMLLVPMTSAVDINSDVNEESRENYEIEPLDGNKEIITWICSIGEASWNWIKQMGIFHGEIEIYSDIEDSYIWIRGLTYPIWDFRNSWFEETGVRYIHANYFVGLILMETTGFVYGVALGNIEWHK